jgi:hypothetical protein
VQHAGAAAVGKRLLCNQLFREVKIKVRNQHSIDYRTCGINFWEGARATKCGCVTLPKER